MKKLRKETIREIRKHQGKTGREIAALVGVGINTASRYMRDKRIEKTWSERELQKVTNWRSKGISYAEIGRRLHRTGNSVRIRMCRYRKTIRNDPQKQIALHYLVQALRTEPNPTLALRAVRKARIFEMERI